MAKEKANYKETLDFLMQVFDGKIYLKIIDISKAFQMNERTVKKRYKIDKHGIEITKLASRICDSTSEVFWR